MQTMKNKIKKKKWKNGDRKKSTFRERGRS